MKHILMMIAISLITAPAMAQDYDNPQPVQKAQSYRVTSVDDCLSQLPPSQAAEVRQSLKPYEECQKRLKGALEKKESEKETAEKEAEKPPVAETPRNFVRVQPVQTPEKKTDKP